MNHEKQVYNINEVAKLYDCSPNTIRLKLKKKLMPKPLPRKTDHEPLQWSKGKIDDVFKSILQTPPADLLGSYMKQIIKQEVDAQLEARGL